MKLKLYLEGANPIKQDFNTQVLPEIISFILVYYFFCLHDSRRYEKAKVVE